MNKKSDIIDKNGIFKTIERTKIQLTATNSITTL